MTEPSMAAQMADALRPEVERGNPEAARAMFRLITAEDPDAEARAIGEEAVAFAQKAWKVLGPVVETVMAWQDDGIARAEAHANRAQLEEAARLLVRHGGPWSGEGPTDAMVQSVAERLLDPDTVRSRDGFYRIAVRRAGDDADLVRRLSEARDVVAGHQGRLLQ